MEQIKTEFIQNIKPEPFFNDIIIRRALPPVRQYAIFPLTPPPNCRSCGITSQNRKNVISSNPNGNVGRPYYICEPCKVGGRRVWITWDDERGIYTDNPECDCGMVSRRDRAGANRATEGCEFWTCAVGRCRYWESVKIQERVYEDAKIIEGAVRVKIKLE